MSTTFVPDCSYRNWNISSLDSRHDYRKIQESRIKNTQVLRINMRVTVNLLLGGTLKKIMTSTPVAWNRVWHCSRKSCIKCTTYRLVSYLLAVTVSTLPCTLYVVLISRLFIQHIANMLLANLPLCTLQYLPPPPDQKKILHNLSFSFLQRTMYYSRPKEKLKTMLMQIFQEQIRYIMRDVQVVNKKKK